MVIIVLGVTGAGKSTVGRALARELDWRFLDADDLHPRANVEKMSRNEPLSDADREPWLLAVKSEIVTALATHAPLVVACSALKRHYRRTLAEGLTGITFVYLRGSREELKQRLAGRRGHFAGPGLLDSQLATLEEPDSEEAIVLHAMLPLETLVGQIREALGV
jgi:carbohydrate kinase (thermoresistant glucokinase family)